ncbi:metallophosphoesterase [Candidatus Woesearchaeota archaeon]|nr:metallophosphoesterase [Candidatus Woesearchaeota archaeon]
MSKNLICSDVHGDLEALARFLDFAHKRQADRIILAGDYILDVEGESTQDRFKNMVEQLAITKALLDKADMPYYAIPGNYECSLEKIFREHDLHKKTVMFDDAKVLGYGGASFQGSPFCIPQDLGDLAEFMVPFYGEEFYNLADKHRPSIIITHHPAYGLCDELSKAGNVGSKYITAYIDKTLNQPILTGIPKLIISGHIHGCGPTGKECKGIMKCKNERTSRIFHAINPGNLGVWHEGPSGTFVEADLEKDGTLRKLTQYSLRGSDTPGKVRVVDTYTFE